MMFDLPLSIQKLFLLPSFSFVILFAIRQFLSGHIVCIFLYHICLFCTLIILFLGGSDAQNDGYAGLKDFIILEKNNQLEDAKNNLPNHDPKLQVYLEIFKDSAEFRDYLETHDTLLNKVEEISIGSLFVVLSEISTVFVLLLRFIARRVLGRTQD